MYVCCISMIWSLAIAAVVRFGLYPFASTFNALSNCVSGGFIFNSLFDFDSQCIVFSHSYRIVILMDINVELLARSDSSRTVL